MANESRKLFTVDFLKISLVSILLGFILIILSGILGLLQDPNLFAPSILLKFVPIPLLFLIGILLIIIFIPISLITTFIIFLNHSKDFDKVKTIILSLFVSTILLLLVSHVLHALAPPSLIHPDEIFQIYEIAHKFVYGYGYEAWEWQIGGWPTEQVPEGYGPTRSLLSPLIVGGIFNILEKFGFNYWNQILPFTRIILLGIFLFGIGIAALLLKRLGKEQGIYLVAIFLFLTLNYHDFLFYGSKALTNTLVAPFVFGSLFLFLNTYEGLWRYASGILGGFLVGFSIWLRPDAAIFMAIFVLLFINHMKIYKIFTFGSGFILAFLVNGYLDELYYGSFFITFPNYLRFVNDNQEVFGTNPFGWYFEEFLVKRDSLAFLYNLSLLLFLFSSIYLIYQLYQLLKRQIEQISSSFLNFYVNYVRLFLWVFLTLIWWETQPHKEHRFLILWQISFFLLSAYALFWIIRVSKNKIKVLVKHFNYEKVKFLKIPDIEHHLQNLLLLTIILGLFSPYIINVGNENEQPPWDLFDDVLAAQSWVGQQENLKGIIIIGSFFYDGGFTYLHRNVTTRNIPEPGANYSFNYEFKQANEFNYVISPHYKYYYFPSLQSNLKENGWELEITILERTDVWYHNGSGS